MEKLIKADIECLLNTTKRAVDEDNACLAMSAATSLIERIADLMRLEALREVSHDHSD